MKQLVVVTQNSDANKFQEALRAQDYRHTKLASTGGFLREGNTTFMLAVKDDEVWYVKEIIKKSCQTRSRLMPSDILTAEEGLLMEPMEVTVGGAVVFILPLEEMLRL